MKKQLACLVCAAVLLVLGGCTPAGEVSPTPTPGESVTPSAAPESSQSLPPIRKPFTPEPMLEDLGPGLPEDLAEFLAGLTAEDIISSDEYIGTPGTTAEDFLALLQNAVEHPVDGDAYERDFLGLWTIMLPLERTDPNTGQSYDPFLLSLDAGLAENLVQIELYSEGRRALWVEDEGLYDLIRGRDYYPCILGRSDQIDREALALYQEAVDAYLVENDYWAGADISYTHELIGFELADQSPALNAQVYHITAVFVTDPPELAAARLAGGCYLDGQLRYHPMSSDPRELLVTMDGKALGIASLSWLHDDGGLAQYESKEALLADFPA